MRLLIKFPTRARPERFKQTFDGYYSRLSGKHKVDFLLTMDADDRSMNNPDMHKWIENHKNVMYCYGQSRSKVEAINANMEGQEFDILLLASDDMTVQVDGYDDIIIKRMNQHFSDLSGCLHFNDGRTGPALNTLSIMGKKMYDHFGYIYHNDYKSLWCVTGDSRVYMANHTHKPISEIKVGDMAVGTEKRMGAKSSKLLEYLKPAEVTAVHSRIATVFKVTLASGAIIRCTNDHQWAHYGDGKELSKYAGEHSASTYYYGPIQLGRKLVRTFTMPEAPPLGSDRELGWLGGMYDGEGSFPGITQSLYKNPENCAELERILNKYHFNYVIKAYDRSKWNLQDPKSDIMNVYWISGGRDEYIKFLDWTKPVRTNRNQVNKRLFTARFGRPDEIIDIKEEIAQPVYCITTSTGNFIVEGLLSHNCDNEFHEVTKQMGKYVYLDQTIISHGWHDLTGNDGLARRNDAFYNRDQQVFRIRQKAGFPKHSMEGDFAVIDSRERRRKIDKERLRRP